MRVLLISDIHSNLIALETVLAHAPAFDAVWCLGDIVGYGPAPNECVERIRGLNALVLTGNHDEAAVGRVALEEFSEDARRALAWTRKISRPENIEWLASHSPRHVPREFDLTLVHASPRDPIWEYIDNTQLALENFAFFETSVCLFGHTHRPIAYELRERDRVITPRFLPDNRPYPVQRKLLLNPGSVGQPRDGDPRAAYAIFDTDGQLLIHYRVEYDVAATQLAMANANLPHRLIVRLAQGA
jgi:predicted phosphodiesterase